MVRLIIVSMTARALNTAERDIARVFKLVFLFFTSG
jgi:hypothetical protein